MSRTDPTRVVTGKARSTFMFCTALEDRTKDGTGPKTVKTAIMWPKKDKTTTNRVLAAVGAAAKKKFGKAKYSKPGRPGCPVRDIDAERDDDVLPDSMSDAPDDHYFMNATGYRLPGLIVDGEEIDKDDTETREETLVSGFFFKFSLRMKGFEYEGQKGVRVELQNILFLEEGERLDGGLAADQEDWGDDDDEEPSRRRGRRGRDDDDDDEEDDEEEDDTPRRRRGRRGRRR